MNVKSQAQDAARWYFAHLEVSDPNHENVQRYLRGALVALTVNHILPVMAPPSVGQVAVIPNGSSNTNTKEDMVKKEGEENISSGSSDWREYLSSPQTKTTGAANTVPGTPGSSSPEANEEAKLAYESLGRRTKARMEAFLAGCALAAPLEVDPHNSHHRQGKNPQRDIMSLQEGLSGLGISSSTSNSGNTNTVNSSQLHPQIDQTELVLRLELYIRTLQRVKSLQDDCVIAMESPKTIKVRARIMTHAFVATAGTIRNLRHVLTRLLNCLTMEMLAVEVLSDELTMVIRRIVAEYEHGTSFASLAFLSTPEVNADSLLSPLIVKYLRYLQSNWQSLISACELERMLTRALDPTMRRLFKTIEFRSIGHLLEVCHDQRDKLQYIELAPHVCAVAENINTLVHSKEALRQALRDLQREIITVNGHVLPPVNSRKELLNLLTQTLNSRTLTAAERPSRSKKNKRHSHLRRRESAPAKIGSLEQQNPPPGPGVTTPVKAAKNKENLVNTPQSTGSDDSDYLFSSEAESGMSDAHDDSSLSGPDKNPPPSTDNKKVHRRNFHLSTIDLLTRRLLIAASRTGNGGDAYFMVRDLFGGDEVEVVPTSQWPVQHQLHGRMVRPGTIDILVRLASVTIKCHQSFDVYPKSLVGDCEPLIQFHTIATETISLQEIRSSSPSRNGESSQPPDTVDGTSAALLVLQEHQSGRTGWRNISIRPAIYEKVQSWGTPS